MTRSKFSMAAVIAVGLVSLSISTTMAACPCGQHQNLSDCPKNNCTKEYVGCDNNITKSDMKQVYNYPYAIYGENNYVGETQNSIYSTYSAWDLDNRSNGVKVSTEGSLTGAAASCGCANKGFPVLESNQLNHDKLPCSSCGEDEGGMIDIETDSSIQAVKKSFAEINPSEMMTGAAAPLSNIFPDVPQGYWASCDINRLATTSVVAGYPDRMFKPSIPVTRAEFASMIVKGFNHNVNDYSHRANFKDVSPNHWASPAISKAVEEGLMCGCGGNKFMPQKHVSRVEALTAMSKGIPCDMDQERAKNILSQYCDGSSLPEWAQIPVAKALDAGALKDNPQGNRINPNQDASRADVASMLNNTRIAANYDSIPVAEKCDSLPTKAYVENEEIVKIPTLRLKFLDEINAKSSHVGQQFATTTLEPITINGKLYPAGSRVNGRIVEVIRPNKCDKGSLKLSFDTIQGCDGCKAELPKQVLTAQVDACRKKQNIVSRTIAMPFTLAGSLIGIVGRTTGGMISSAGNAAESLTSGTGIALGETMQGQFRAAGRSLQDALVTTVKAPVDFAMTGVTGAFNLLQNTGDEVAYLVDPNGRRISQVNPKEQITIAFGCDK
jgi:hypothetical protein